MWIFRYRASPYLGSGSPSHILWFDPVLYSSLSHLLCILDLLLQLPFHLLGRLLPPLLLPTSEPREEVLPRARVERDGRLGLLVHRSLPFCMSLPHAVQECSLTYVNAYLKFSTSIMRARCCFDSAVPCILFGFIERQLGREIRSYSFDESFRGGGGFVPDRGGRLVVLLPQLRGLHWL